MEMAAALSSSSPPACSTANLAARRALPWSPFFPPHPARRRSSHPSSSPFRGRISLLAPRSSMLEHVPEPAVAALSRLEAALYTLADSSAAVVATDAAAATSTDVQKTNDWLSGLTDSLEYILKVMENGLAAVHVPYAYGFAIILLTILVKAATFPLTKQQVESGLAMQNLAPKLKAIQKRYAGDQERIQLETARLYKQAGVNPLAGCLPTLATIPVFIGLYRALSNVATEGLLTEGFFWIPSLAGPTSISARQSGSGISWLFPFVDGHPPLGWNDTLAYLVLPVMLIISQYVSMQMIQTPQSDDPSQKNTQLILKFLPLMIGYFSLSVPSGLSLYWLTNNFLSTGQQVWLRKFGGAKPIVGKDGGGIISAGQALRSASPTNVDPKERRRGERFQSLKTGETKKKEKSMVPAALSETDEQLSSDNEGETVDLSSAKDTLEELYSRNESGIALPDGSGPKKSKRSKRRRAA